MQLRLIGRAATRKREKEWKSMKRLEGARTAGTVGQFREGGWSCVGWAAAAGEIGSGERDN